jgi:hypothetical protein
VGGWGWGGLRPVVTIKVGRGRRYNIVSCKEVNGLEEGLQKMLEEYCRVRTGKGVVILSFFIIRDKDGSVAKIWSLEVHHSLYGPVIYLADPWNM